MSRFLTNAFLTCSSTYSVFCFLQLLQLLMFRMAVSVIGSQLQCIKVVTLYLQMIKEQFKEVSLNGTLPVC